MTREEAEKYAKNMTYREAICNLKQAKSMPYRKATFIKVNELIDELEQRPTTKNDLGVDWESYKDVDGNSLDDLILEVLQNNFDCGNTYGYKVADEIIGLLPSVTPQEPTTKKRLKADIVAMLTELKNELIDVSWNMDMYDSDLDFECCYLNDINEIIQQKINSLEAESEG